MDATWDCKDGSLLLLALDWAKAFDCICPERLLAALRRFGLPSGFVQMVDAIYQDRWFMMQDKGGESDWHRQHSGISQGCPLSPFLFVLAMTVLLDDAESKFLTELGDATLPPHIISRDLLYADDTLIVESDAGRAERFMHIIADCGAEYGLALNWQKVKLLRINHPGVVRAPDGSEIKTVDSLLYLGATLDKEVRHTSELARRIGAARKDFFSLAQVWKHAGISRQRKVQVYDACIVSNLLYGVETIWLNKGDKQRLDAFHYSCLRKCLGIPHSYVSHITNESVLQQAGGKTLSSRILIRQLALFARYARMEPSAITRQYLFADGTLEPRRWDGRKRRGRPRNSWVKSVHALALSLVGGQREVLQRMMLNTSQARNEWNNLVHHRIL